MQHFLFLAPRCRCRRWGKEEGEKGKHEDPLLKGSLKKQKQNLCYFPLLGRYLQRCLHLKLTMVNEGLMVLAVWARHPHFSFKRFEWEWGLAGITAALPKEVKDVANGSRRPPPAGRIWREGQKEADRRRRNNATSLQVPGGASLMGRGVCLGKAHFGSQDLCSGTPPGSLSGGGP